MATAEQLELIHRAHEVAAGDPRVLAAWIAGSIANGNDDRYADVDLHILVADEDIEAFHDAWMQLIRRITPVVMVRRIGGIVGGYAITPQWMHLDVVCHAVSRFDPVALRGCWPLFDRTDTLPTKVTPGPDPWGEPYFPADAVEFYYYLLGNLVVVLGRGELNLAVNGAIVRRDVGLVPVMLAENGVRKHDGNKRLNPYLLEDQRTFLHSLPPLSPVRESIIAYDRMVAAELSRRGRALASATGARWPAEFEAATLAYLSRELGMEAR